MYCAQCGQNNDAANRFCQACGRVLTQDGSIPSAGTTTPAIASQSALEAAFVGSNAHYYLAKWQATRSAQNSRSWNNAACFFNFIWLAYRKMYGLACLFALIMLGTTLAEIAFDITGGPIDLLVNLACALVCGYWGNVWYQKHARRKIAASSSSGLPLNQWLAHLKRQGGTNLPASLGFVVFFLATSVIFIFFFGSSLLTFFLKLYFPP
jgi:hypothetical protein